MTYRIRFETPSCPDCGKTAAGTVEIIKAVAELKFVSSDAAMYTANTSYGEQYTLARGTHQVELTCPEGHEWPSYVLGSGLAALDDIAQPRRDRLSMVCRLLQSFAAFLRRRRF